MIAIILIQCYPFPVTNEVLITIELAKLATVPRQDTVS